MKINIILNFTFKPLIQRQTLENVCDLFFIDTGQQLRCLDSSKSSVYRCARTQPYSLKMLRPGIAEVWGLDWLILSMKYIMVILVN